MTSNYNASTKVQRLFQFKVLHEDLFTLQIFWRYIFKIFTRQHKDTDTIKRMLSNVKINKPTLLSGGFKGSRGYLPATLFIVFFFGITSLKIRLATLVDVTLTDNFDPSFPYVYFFFFAYLTSNNVNGKTIIMFKQEGMVV